MAFDEYFADGLRRLRPLREDGLVLLGADAVRFEGPLGRLLIRVVAAVCDRYLPPNAFREGLAARPSSRVA